MDPYSIGAQLFEMYFDTNHAISSQNIACGLYTILYNQQMSPNAPVLLETAVICHPMLSFHNVDDLNSTI